MKKNAKISIIGDGGWGTTLAILLNNKGYNVSMWGPFADYVKFLDERRENVKFLPQIKIPRQILITNNMKEAAQGSSLIVLAIPSRFARQVVSGIKNLKLERPIFLSVIKGIENQTLMRMTEVVSDELGSDIKIAVLSGPSISYEVARGIPTTVVAASAQETIACEIQDIFMTERFRVYTNTDVIGVELGGALKNIIAIAAGISDGLGFGTNSKAALLVRGLAEIIRIGVKLGARRETFSGISGLGDLVTTCISPHGRNRFVGEQIGKGKQLVEVLKGMEMVAEGVSTTKSAYQLSEKYNVDMPITRQVYSVLYENKDPLQAVSELMTRGKKSEIEN